MGTLTAELAVPTTGKPLLTVIRSDAPTAPRLGFVAAFDLLGKSIGVYTRTGAPLHCTAAFRAALEQAPIASVVRSAVSAVSAQIAAASRPTVVPPPVCVREQNHVVRASLYQPSDDPMVLVCIEASVEASVTDSELVSRFGLTPAEVRVARLLARGDQNKEIACALGVSAHTARHHTERVMRKLGINSRAAVANRLRGE